MLGVLNKSLVDPPKELNSPSSSNYKPKVAKEIMKDFLSSNPNNGFSIAFGDKASLAYVPPQRSYPLHQQRLFCGVDDIYCIFLGSLNNLCQLIKNYGLSKSANEAIFAIEAYRTLRDRGPYPAHQVLRELEGSFAFLIFDTKAQTVFIALGADEKVKLYWGIAGDGSVVISDDVNLTKASCSKSFAPFPPGCMYHTERGLTSFEHPMNKMKAMPRIDSEGAMCGANFKVDVYSRAQSMPRVGSEANWATWGQQA